MSIKLTTTLLVSGLCSDVTKFFRYILALMLLNFSVGSLALAIGAAVGKFSIANPIYVMILVVSMVSYFLMLISLHKCPCRCSVDF